MKVAAIVPAFNEGKTIAGVVKALKQSPLLGEVIVISENGLESRVLVSKKHAHCFFEWIYFADPTSKIEGRNVYEARKELGLL